MRTSPLIRWLWLFAFNSSVALAQSEPEQSEPESSVTLTRPPPTWGLQLLSKIRIHGFVSEGAFISTANRYIGESSQGSFKMLESGLNIAVEPVDGLRVGVQLVARSVGTLSDDVPRLDWAVIDYLWQPWLGVRAGLIKMPLGLYNEFADIDSTRNAILLPASLYPIRNREALISYLGFAVYGNIALGPVGELSYEAWIGTLLIPRSALTITNNARLDSINTQYVTGARLLWRPLEGLRMGFTYMRAVIDFFISLDAPTTSQVIMANLVPADFDGRFSVSQDPTSLWVGSVEYIMGNWLLAAEYGRALKHQAASITALSPTLNENSERFYVMLNYRLSSHLELGTYYSVVHADDRDRTGKSDRFEKRFHAFQRDLAATIRVDINTHWLCKLEGHFIDGTAELQTTENQDPKRYWGLFLFRTTVTF